MVRLSIFRQKKHRKKASIFDPVDIKDLIKSAEILKVKTVSKGASDYFFDKDIIKIENRNLDVVVRFGFNILKENFILYKVWNMVLPSW